MIIYKVTNLINGKCYVGKTISTPKKRWYRHCWDAYNRRKYGLHNAIRKYGKENFSIEQIDTADSIEELNEKEKYWIKELNTKSPDGYNLTYVGEGHLGFKFSKDECLKRSLRTRRENNPMFGKTHTQESRKKISNALRGKSNNVGESNPFYGKKHSPDAIEKFKIMHKGSNNTFAKGNKGWWTKQLRKHTKEQILIMHPELIKKEI